MRTAKELWPWIAGKTGDMATFADQGEVVQLANQNAGRRKQAQTRCAPPGGT